MAGRASRRREQLGRALPIVQWASAYRRTDLRGDLLAGGVVAALMIPQALGYARIAGVPVQVGLYAIPLALLAYAVLGSSRQLMVGPASTVAIVSGSLVADIAPGDPAEAIKVTAALAIATGVVLVTIGLLRVGWVAEFLSKPIVTGFVIGLALTIIVGELPRHCSAWRNRQEISLECWCARCASWTRPTPVPWRSALRRSRC
jgi:MFS superfamily sulfate permease-like transporter